MLFFMHEETIYRSGTTGVAASCAGAQYRTKSCSSSKHSFTGIGRITEEACCGGAEDVTNDGGSVAEEVSERGDKGVIERCLAARAEAEDDRRKGEGDSRGDITRAPLRCDTLECAGDGEGSRCIPHGGSEDLEEV